MGTGIKHKTTGKGTKLLDSVWSEEHVIDGHVLPDTIDSYNLGSAAKRFNAGFIKTLDDVHVINNDGANDIDFVTTYGIEKMSLVNLGAGENWGLRPGTTGHGKFGDSTKLWKEVNCTTLNATYGVVYARTLFFDVDGKSYQPGDTDWHSIGITGAPGIQSYVKPAYARVIGYAQADEAGATFVDVHDETVEVCQEGWSGSDLTQLVGSWTAYTCSSDRSLTLRYKASSDTETLTLYNVILEMR